MSKPEAAKEYTYINDEWRMYIIPYNIVLEQKKITTNRKTKESKEVWKISGYYSTYNEVLHSIVNREITISKNFKELVDKIDKLHQLIDNITFKKVELCKTEQEN
jgi:hypothetical protein